MLGRLRLDAMLSDGPTGKDVFGEYVKKIGLFFAVPKKGKAPPAAGKSARSARDWAPQAPDMQYEAPQARVRGGVPVSAFL